MYQTINFSQFVDAFVDMGRTANFEPNCEDALRVLFDYLEEVHDEAYELDVIGLCCDFSHDTAQEIANSYSLDVAGMDDEDANEVVRDYLNYEGMLIGETEYGFVYRQH